MSDHEHFPIDGRIVQLLMESDIVGSHTAVGEEIKPTTKQYALGPGDKAIIASTHALIDHDFTIAKVVDAEEYKHEYPDYEERLMNSYLLCEWVSNHHSTPETGWYSRMKLVPVSDEQYDEILNYMKEDGLPEAPPDWLSDVYSDFIQELSDASPGKLPTLVRCEKCNSANVELHASMMIEIHARVGSYKHEGQTTYTAMSAPDKKETIVAHLHCLDCKAVAEFTADEMGSVKIPFSPGD